MQEEDPGYAADKLQAADELRQWSEAAQCSSIACLVGEHFSFPAACHAVLGKCSERRSSCRDDSGLQQRCLAL